MPDGKFCPCRIARMNKFAVLALGCAVLVGCSDLAWRRASEPPEAGASGGGTGAPAVEIAAPPTEAPPPAKAPVDPPPRLPPVSDARVLQRSVPPYPSQLAEQGVAGTVVAAFDVNPEGRADRIRIVSSPHPLLSQAVTRSLEAWRFEPARDANGHGLRSAMRVPFRFVVEE